MQNNSIPMNPNSNNTHTLPIRVRYCEIDGQGRVHNAQYLNYFERGRVEMLRDFGISYKAFENSGFMLVVKKVEVEFITPAEFDEDLELITTLHHSYGARIDHEYKLVRPLSSPLVDTLGPVVVTGRTSIACVDRTGKVKRLPRELQLFRSDATGSSGN